MSNYYIMSAGCLFNNKAATIAETTEQWPDGTSTILVARRETGYNKTSKLFVHGSGAGYEETPKKGETLTKRYTQDTGMGYSNKNKQLHIDNIITLKDGVIVDSGNGIGVTEKRRIWVMK